MSSEITGRSRNIAAGLLVLEPGVVVAEKYRLEKLLQSGGMGAVWSATHLGLETIVAIKFMHTRLLDLPASAEDEDGAQANPRAITRMRFEREAKAAARIRSTNVVQMLDHGIDHGMPYIVMEFLRGEDLETRLKRVGRLAIGELLPIVTAIGRALQLAHAEGVVHRDLKPENIFLAKEGDEEIPKILDFGVAKAKSPATESVSETATMQGTMVGTPHYMSPEQIQVGGQVDHRADLWAFGVLIFRTLTGRLPFPSSRLFELAMQICKEPIPKATSIAPDLPPSVDAFLKKALNRDPARRYQSAREMVVAFQEFASGQLPSSSTSTVSLATNVAPADKPALDKRTLLLFFAGMAIVFVVAGGVFAWVRGSAVDRVGAAGTASTQPAATPVSMASSNVPNTPASAAPESTDASPAAPASASASQVGTTTKAPLGKPGTTGTGKTKKRNVGY